MRMLLSRYGGILKSSVGRLSPITQNSLPRRGLSNSHAEKPYYITTPIFYPNAVPHIGHLHSSVIADIFARFARIARPDRPVYFMTGTDEHGLKIQKAAKEKGMEPLAFCDQLSESFRDLASKANISHTRFSRTTEQQHYDAVQHLWRQLDAKGLIYKGAHEGWYSISDECFYPKGQVAEVQPPDGSEPYHISTETRSKVEWQQEENYKFRLSSFRESLLAHFQQNPDAIFPPQHHADVVAALSETLEDISVSRPTTRLSWGVPVPGDDQHSIYVWIDALTVYLSSTGYPWKSTGGDGLSHGWPPNLQIIGKDILRFHAIYLPAMLQALDIPLAHQLLAHSHWTVEQRKMSKSVGNVADPLEAIDKYGLDVVRYYLARVGGRFKDDVDWSDDQLAKHSREITSSLGNLLMRMSSKKITQRVEDLEDTSLTGVISRNNLSESLIGNLISTIDALSIKTQAKMQQLLVADALEQIILVLNQANHLVTETAPWSPRTDARTIADVQTSILETLRISGILLQPFIPDGAKTLLDTLGVPEDQRTLEFAGLGKGQLGKVQSGVRIFPSPKLPVDTLST